MPPLIFILEYGHKNPGNIQINILMKDPKKLKENWHEGD